MPNATGKRIPERKRVKYTGRGKGHSFLRLPHFLLESQEFAQLSPTAVKLLLDVARLYRGSNNGDIAIVWSSLKLRGWRSQTTIQKAKDELLQANWLICTRHGGRNRCSLYALSWEPIDECPGKGLEVPPTRVASHLWRNRSAAPENGVTLLQKVEQSDGKPPKAEQDCSRNWSSEDKKAA